MEHVLGAERVPLIRLRNYLLVPVQGALSDRTVLRLQEDIGLEIRSSDVRALVVDVSGIDLMDSFIARSIRDIGLMARLMGVETVVCGIGPIVAITLVEMGMEIRSVSTALNLDGALAMLDERLAALERRDRRLLEQLAEDQPEAADPEAGDGVEEVKPPADGSPGACHVDLVDAGSDCDRSS